MLTRNRLLSIRPWKIGTPISMHLEITSRRSSPASRANSVGVRWIAIGTASWLACDKHHKCGIRTGRVNRWELSEGCFPARGSDRVRHVDERVGDPEALGE